MRWRLIKLQSVKHAISNLKTQIFASYMNAFQTGRLNSSLSRGETSALTKVLSKLDRNKGFHLFIQDSNVKQEVAKGLAARDERLRLKAKNEGQKYKAEAPLNAYHAVRSGLWRELTKEERAEWEAKGKSTPSEKKLIPAVDE